MTDRPIIQADFVKPMPIPSRKVLQLVFEVAEEEADHAMEVLGGYPQSGQNRWCAIAQLGPGVSTPSSTPPAEQPETVTQPHVEHRKWDELSPTQQAGIRCNDPIFGEWLINYMNADTEDAAELVRDYCNVKSRADLNRNAMAARAWQSLDEEFQDAQITQHLEEQRWAGR